MTDKEIILRTLDHIKHHNGHTDIKNFWNEIGLDNDTQSRIKIKLEDNDLATPHIYDAWSLMITTTGLRINQKDLNDEGNLKRKKRNSGFMKGVIATLITVTVTICLTEGVKILKEKWLKVSGTKTIVLPPIQIVRDTVYLKKELIGQNTAK